MSVVALWVGVLVLVLVVAAVIECFWGDCD